MKLLLGVHHFPPRYIGGAESEAKRCAAELRARGHDVRVICVERIDEGPADDLVWSDDVHDGIPVRRFSFDLGRAADRFRWEYDNPWVGRHLRTLLAAERPDVFLLFSGYLLSGSALIAAREAGVPSIVRLTDFWYFCPRIIMLRSDGALSRLPIDPATCARCLGEEKRRYRVPGRIWPAFMKAFWRLRRARVARIQTRLDFLRGALRSAAALLSPSQFLRNMYVATGVDPERIHFMRQGISLPPTVPEPPPSAPLRLGYMGQIAPLKGVDVLLRAVRALPRAALEVKVYGDLGVFPAYADSLRQLAAGDARIELCGPYQQSGGLMEAMSRLHAVVVPSVWYENSPNAILESFAYGRPVIASDLGGMAELVQHEESGLLFHPGDAIDLANQIDRMLREPSLLPVLRSGVPPMKSSAEEISEYEAWCRRVLDQHRGAAAPA